MGGCLCRWSMLLPSREGREPGVCSARVLSCLLFIFGVPSLEKSSPQHMSTYEHLCLHLAFSLHVWLCASRHFRLHWMTVTMTFNTNILLFQTILLFLKLASSLAIENASSGTPEARTPTQELQGGVLSSLIAPSLWI